ncbi:MAG: hypothetical protein PHW13_09630 [Methylococcales bacterium]|nr:hypothetical protein [Methylococcales bacterium]
MLFAHIRILALTSCLGYILAGCASVPANSGYSDFSSYAEAVFRHQNQVTSRLMMLNEADLIPDSGGYQDAEDSMTDACELLNEYAERQSSHENMGWRFKTRVQFSVEGCDASIKRMQELLDKLQTGP